MIIIIIQTITLIFSEIDSNKILLLLKCKTNFRFIIIYLKWVLE